jgi:hypothetical protein
MIQRYALLHQGNRAQRELLDRWVEREDDRRLFNLAPKTATA